MPDHIVIFKKELRFLLFFLMLYYNEVSNPES